MKKHCGSVPHCSRRPVSVDGRKFFGVDSLLNDSLEDADDFFFAFGNGIRARFDQPSEGEVDLRILFKLGATAAMNRHHDSLKSVRGGAGLRRHALNETFDSGQPIVDDRIENFSL